MARGETYAGCVAKAMWDDPGDLASAITRARRGAEMKQQALADYLGKSIGTIKRWEAGEEATLGKTRAARRSTAILVAHATKCPEIFGLSEPEPTAVDHLRQELLQEMDAMKTELLEEIERAHDAQASEQPSQAPGAEG